MNKTEYTPVNRNIVVKSIDLEEESITKWDYDETQVMMKEKYEIYEVVSVANDLKLLEGKVTKGQYIVVDDSMVKEFEFGADTILFISENYVVGAFSGNA